MNIYKPMTETQIIYHNMIWMWRKYHHNPKLQLPLLDFVRAAALYPHIAIAVFKSLGI